MTQMQTTAALPALTREELEAHWMPFTPNREFKQNPRMIVRAEGCHYVTDDGRRVFDSLSGLWCCGLGHGRTEISRAVAQQIQELDYAPAFQFGHPLSFRLANMIKAMTPDGLDYVFFTNSGSEAAAVHHGAEHAQQPQVDVRDLSGEWLFHKVS